MRVALMMFCKKFNNIICNEDQKKIFEVVYIIYLWLLLWYFVTLIYCAVKLLVYTIIYISKLKLTLFLYSQSIMQNKKISGDHKLIHPYLKKKHIFSLPYIIILCPLINKTKKRRNIMFAWYSSDSLGVS